MKYVIPIVAGAFTVLAACTTHDSKTTVGTTKDSTLQPAVISEPVAHDSDDPAIWINPADPAKSLIIGTDKSEDGALYVFDLQGKMQQDKVVKGLKRPNNVDIAYGMSLLGKATDIAVATERLSGKLRIFSVPDMKPVDQGGIPVFTGEQPEDNRAPMGVALYKNKAGQQYAFVSRKSGPSGSYLWQYLLEDNGSGAIKATVIRKFGQYTGGKEIEAIAVDARLGYVYYSDEGKGVRKYYADPEKGNEELALFATTGFRDDHEGISVYQLTDTTGYILVSDQGDNKFQIFPREGIAGKPHQHPLLKTVQVSANHSDGSDIVSIPLNSTFKHGLFVAMSDNKTFHFYKWEDIAGNTLQSAH